MRLSIKVASIKTTKTNFKDPNILVHTDDAIYQFPRSRYRCPTRLPLSAHNPLSISPCQTAIRNTSYSSLERSMSPSSLLFGTAQIQSVNLPLPFLPSRTSSTQGMVPLPSNTSPWRFSLSPCRLSSVPILLPPSNLRLSGALPPSLESFSPCGCIAKPAAPSSGATTGCSPLHG